MSENENAPYATSTVTNTAETPGMAQTPFSLDTVKKIRTIHLERAKAEGEKFSMLTCYDFSTAQVFDRAGIEMLLIGDSAANVMLGYDSTLVITLDEIIPMVSAVSRGAKRAMVVADLPFGTYEQRPMRAWPTGCRPL